MIPGSRGSSGDLWGVGVVAVALTIISAADYLFWNKVPVDDVARANRSKEG